MKIFVKIFSGLVASCTWLIILAAAIFLIPRVAGYTPYVVMSGSMEPVIHTGAVAFINTKDTDCQVGDIITYRLRGNNGEEILVTHRIVEEQDGMYITQGDAMRLRTFRRSAQSRLSVHIRGRFRWLDLLWQN